MLRRVPGPGVERALRGCSARRVGLHVASILRRSPETYSLPPPLSRALQEEMKNSQDCERTGCRGRCACGQLCCACSGGGAAAAACTGSTLDRAHTPLAHLALGCCMCSLHNLGRPLLLQTRSTWLTRWIAGSSGSRWRVRAQGRWVRAGPSTGARGLPRAGCRARVASCAPLLPSNARLRLLPCAPAGFNIAVILIFAIQSTYNPQPLIA